MTDSNENLHTYLREINRDERNSLTVLANTVTEGARVLDLGIGGGALGKFLHEQRSCILDGFTINQEEAGIAQSHYRRLVVGDLDSCDLAALFEGAQYDFIICADVLEHLKAPERVLQACRGLLAPQGRLLISVPNAAYCGLVAELMSGDFAYRAEGLLDKTHLRFFTRRSLLRFLAEQHWTAESMQVIDRELPASEFRVAFDQLPPSVARYLLAIPDATTYQFIAIARPAELHEETPAPLPIGPSGGQAMFTAQLFLGSDGAFSEDRKVLASGVIGTQRQVLTFQLPESEMPLTSLRFDPADRPGFLHLYRLTLKADDGTKEWEWNSAADEVSSLQATEHHEILFRSPWPGSAAALLLLHGDDPWLVIPIARSATQNAPRPATFEVELGWPMSADYLALSDLVNPLRTRLAASEHVHAAERLALQRSSENALNKAQEELREAQSNAAEQYALLDEKHQLSRMQGERLAEQNQQLLAQKSEWIQQNQSLQRKNLELQKDREARIQHLQWIENSTVFRATRPLVNFKMWLDQRLGAKPVPIAAQRYSVPDNASAYPVDVIVPVYRNLQDTRCCIESALASPCKTKFRLIVINDASPDADVTAWLRQIDGQDERMMLLENPVNLGFVATVNRGMSLSTTNDVVLLNSDAEVANDWLDRLHRAAYTDRRVASVTPFSNNATICSYPRFCEDNALPDGYDTARLDNLFAQTNAGQTIDIPTAIGFCMYIRRDCLENVGLFDVASFGKGYGEENDFCCRASAAGWRNLHALDTFVRHAGGVSFGASKSTRELEAMETMRRLHPDYERVVHQFVAADPAWGYRKAVDLAMVRASSVPTVLAVMHNRAGGTLRHVVELASHLARQAVFFVLTPAEGGNLLLELQGSSEPLQLWFHLPEEFDDLVSTLQGLGVQHVHFHHLIGHGAQTLALPRRLSATYDFTAHDFYAMCPQVSFTDHTNGYCGEQGVEQCRNCLRISPAPGSVDIHTWRAEYGQFIAGARYVLAPSQDTARHFASYFPAADVRFAPHTDILPTTVLPRPSPQALPATANLRVAVIGALSPIKGADVLEDVAVEAARNKAPLEFHLIGYAYRSLRTQPRASLTVHGAYEEQDLPKLLEWLSPDVVWFPAQCPETYSYTLSACLKAGLPVVATDLGAFPHRLSGRSWSWIKPWNLEPRAWVDSFLALRKDHFIPNQPPSPHWNVSAVGADALEKEWSYEVTYLEGLSASKNDAPLDAEFLTAHKSGRTQGLRQSTVKMKQNLLFTLIRLRSAKGLRGVARAIPLRWQTRIKTWLQA